MPNNDKASVICSKLRKEECLSHQQKKQCQWIVGKGCTKHDAKQKTQQKTTNILVFTIISKALKVKVFKQVHPDASIGTSFHHAMDVFLHQFTRYILRGSKKQYDLPAIQASIHNSGSSKYPVIYKHIVQEGLKAVNRGMTFFSTKAFAKKIKDTYHKDLTPEAALFLAGGLEYIYTELVELSGNIARESGKKRFQAEHLHRVVADDTELRILASKIAI